MDSCGEHAIRGGELRVSYEAGCCWMSANTGFGFEEERWGRDDVVVEEVDPFAACFAETTISGGGGAEVGGVDADKDIGAVLEEVGEGGSVWGSWVVDDEDEGHCACRGGREGENGLKKRDLNSVGRYDDVQCKFAGDGVVIRDEPGGEGGDGMRE